MKSHEKNVSSKKDPILKVDTTVLEENRETVIISSMANTSVILMSTLMGAFTQVIVNVTDSMTSGIAEAIPGKETGDIISGEIKGTMPEIEQKTKTMISDIRQDIYSQMRQKKKEMKQLLSDPAFDVGPKIISEYDFDLPKLTEELDDNTLAKYSKLLITGDIHFAKMFKALTEWLSTLPKPPESDNQK